MGRQEPTLAISYHTTEGNIPGATGRVVIIEQLAQRDCGIDAGAPQIHATRALKRHMLGPRAR